MIAEIKKSGCVRCGEAHPGCLDFHHVDPSTKYKSGRDGCVAELASRGVSWKMVAAEIAKCELICSNCHRKQHWEERLARVRPPQPEQLRLIGR